jgi:hypothetical protein
MGYSHYIQLGFGRLKFKSESRLRRRERDGEVPVWRIGSLYIVWEPRIMPEPHDPPAAHTLEAWGYLEPPARLPQSKGELDIRRSGLRDRFSAVDRTIAPTLGLS